MIFIGKIYSFGKITLKLRGKMDESRYIIHKPNKADCRCSENSCSIGCTFLFGFKMTS